MRNTKLILYVTLVLFTNIALGQTKESYSDKLLTSTFKIFQQTDSELGHHMLPFIKERFLKELQDTTSFVNSYDSLSKYITIKRSSDSLLKIYCWDERNNGCRWVSTTFAQFKTKSKKIKTVNLGEISADYDEDLYIKDLQKIEINNQPHYLVIGYGGHCGNHKYQVARVYKIKNDTLIKCDSIFENKDKISASTHRSGKIDMIYSLGTKTLSYNHYDFDENTGFYTYEKSSISWKLTKSGFVKTD